MKRLFAGLFLSLIGGAAAADVQLVVRDYRGATSEMSSNGQQARIESGQMPGYAIVDYAAGEFLLVDPARNEATSLRLDADARSNGSAGLAIRLEDLGSGERIAGHATRKYRIVANQEPCGEVHASSKLLQNPAISGLFESMRLMQRRVAGITSGLGAMLPACQRASLMVSGAMGSTGVPMKVVDSGGKVVSEVVSIDSGVSIAPAAYRVPAGMKVVSMDERLGQARQQLQSIPDLNAVMQQLQQGAAGELQDDTGQAQGDAGTAEELQQQIQQQMQQLQDMLQQMQQQ